MHRIVGKSTDCIIGVAAALVALALLSLPAAAGFVQQGAKLVGTGGSGSPGEGGAVALSSDGNTAIVGAPNDGTNGIGAIWVFVRSNGTWVQQGGKLVGTGGVGAGSQGWSVAVSADGNTAIAGAPDDSGSLGAAWVFTRSNGVWSQQGSKLVGSGSVDGPVISEGFSVALSADGNTAIIGGIDDGATVGAAWVFTRSNGVWTQQGSKFVPNDYTVCPNCTLGPCFGYTAALSSDGNTALVGGPCDAAQSGSGDFVGAAWVFTRSNGVWTQQGAKLIGSDAIQQIEQSMSVGLSADGNTALVGRYLANKNHNQGGAWVFTRSSGVWTQQGSELTGSDAVFPDRGIDSVALSADGNTAMLGSSRDNSSAGAAWAFTRSNAVWTQQGSKLLPSDETGAAGFGFSVALSGDGKTAMIGGMADNSSIGAAWAFVPGAASHDFDGNAKGDILWRDSSGNIALWLMNGGSVSAAASVGNIGTTWSIVGQRDFNGDGKSDILWHDNSGNTAIWLMNGGTVTSAAFVGNIPTTWSVGGTGDFNGDGKGDILWRNSNGDVAVWLMNGGTVTSSVFVGNIPLDWTIAGSGGKSILWRDGSGNVAIWLMNGGTVTSTVLVGNVPLAWSIVGSGDFNGDGNIDILWRDSSGNVAIWFLNASGGITSTAFVGNVATTWSIAETGDFNGDGKADILWRSNTGDTAIWMMNGASIASTAFVANIANVWAIQGAGAD